MRIKRSLVAGMTVLAVVALGACGGKSKKSSGGGTTVTDGGGGGGGGTETPVDTTLRLSGALNLLGSSGATALALAGDTYDVYCVTFEDTPTACKAVIDAEGNFDQECKNFAGKAFGCFLRKNNKTVGDIVFEQGGSSGSESQLVAGAGTLAVKINFDPDLGVATAVVDTSKSSALAADKVAAAKAASNLSETTVPNLTGNFSLELLGMLDDEGKVQAPPAGAGQGGEGGDGGKGGKEGIPETIHLNEFDDGGVRKVSIWQSESAKNLCLTGNGTEQKPSFGATVHSDFGRVALDPTNLRKYRDSMGTLVGQFARKYPTSFNQLLSATGQQWESKRCEEQSRNAQNAEQTINDQNCKIVAPGTREVKYWDPVSNREVTSIEPEWFNTWEQVQSAAAVADADIVSRDQTCFNPLVGQPSEGDRFMPPCPPAWNEANKDTATGTFKTYEIVTGEQRRPVQFLCKNPQDSNGGLMFLPVTAPSEGSTYLAASIAAVRTQFQGGGGADASCDKITVAQMFDESGALGLASVGNFNTTQVYKANRRVILQTFGELIRNASHGDGGNECSRWQKPSADELANWSFAANCSQNGGSPICWEKDWILQGIGVKVTDAQDGFEASGGPDQPWMQPGTEKLCTGTNLGSDRPNQGESFEDFQTRRAAAKAACRTEFLGLSTFAAKISRLFDAALDPSKRPPSVVLQCSDDTATKEAVTSMAQNSCLPEAQVDFRCEGGKDCTEVLRCWGTEDGACVDSSGNFKGRIPGRYEMTTLKAGTGGAFNMSSLTTESWTQWAENGEKVCKAARGFKIQGIMKSTSPVAFEGLLSSTSTEVCDGDESEREREDGPNKMQVKFTKQ